MTYKLFLDDERNPPGDPMDWVVVRSYNEAVATIYNLGVPYFISFDHDLADDRTGYDFAKWLVEQDMDFFKGDYIPNNFEFYVHSQNPVGRDNIQFYLDGYLAQR